MDLPRIGMLALTLVALLQITESPAQPSSVVAYVTAKNTNPKQLEVFKKGLAERDYIEGENICTDTMARRRAGSPRP